MTTSNNTSRYTAEELAIVQQQVASKKASSETRKVPIEIIKLPGKSAKIRALNAKGWTNNEIRAALSELYGKEVRFQHVRNVLVTKLSK